MLVSSNNMNDETINYKMYTLIEEGYYADPNRTRSDGTPIDYDYRDSKPGEDTNGTYFYQIPWDRFERTYIQPNGGVRSFYLTLDSGSLVYREMDKESKQPFGKVQKDDNYQRDPDGPSHPPTLLIGEGVIGYPFNTMPFLYYAKQFVGKLYYEIECPSESPSVSPSESPSTSMSPSTLPSATPTVMPTPLSSAVPSGNPSFSMMPVDSQASSAATERHGGIPSSLETMTLSNVEFKIEAHFLLYRYNRQPLDIRIVRHHVTSTFTALYSILS
eukprot:scaffold24893_cov100-Cyclotella_meneghiniana.AAC.2